MRIDGFKFAFVIMSVFLSACAAGEHTSALPRSLASAADIAADPPTGFVDYCDRNPQDCRKDRAGPAELAMTAELWDTLRAVNFSVNHAIRPAEDMQHYGNAEFWTIPIDGRGDCDDYVVAKRKMLSLLGVPQRTMRISVVLYRNAIRHAVLTVVTDRGDFVLDNMRDEIRPVGGTTYVWLERQDPDSRTGWVRMD